MIKSFMTILMTIAFTIFVSGAAFAGSESHSSMTDMSKTGTLFHKSQRVSKLIGSEVQNSKGEVLGKIDDLVTSENGRVSYLIIASGGLMGIGEKLVPVPVAQVTADIASDGKCIIDMEKTVFDKAPGFASNEWPDLTGMEWEAEARGYFSNPSNVPPASMPNLPPATTPGEQQEGKGSSY